MKVICTCHSETLVRIYSLNVKEKEKRSLLKLICVEKKNQSIINMKVTKTKWHFLKILLN
jgi:hypothetical protein